MKVSELAEKLKLDCLAMPMPEREVAGAYAGDLLSRVMGRAAANCVWATIMTHMNVLAVASLADVALAVICEGCEVSDEIVQTAKNKGVNLMRTEMPVYEFCVAVSRCLA